LRGGSLANRDRSLAKIQVKTYRKQYTNSQPLDLWRLSNALLQMGENAIISREVYDLKTAILDPTFTPQLLPVM